MLYFNCDYMEGAHPAILKRLAETNTEQTLGYGNDVYCERAKEKIRKACGCPEADIFFFGGRDPDERDGNQGAVKAI